MKLRTKLILLQLGTLLFAVAIFATVAGLFQTTLALLDQGIEAKTRACLRTLLATADVAIAAEDPVATRRALGACGLAGERDPDLGFVVAYGRHGGVLGSIGTVPTAPAPAKVLAQVTVVRTGNTVRGGGPVAIEGQRFGAVWVEYQGHRIASWRHRFMSAAGMLLLLFGLASAASIAFALHIISPLRKMILFAKEVARGDLRSKVTVRASDELAQLADGLNYMVERIRELQEQLVDASRAAGMAEVATGVLHNVGNVLNSIKTSAAMVDRQAKGGHLETLDKIGTLMEEHQKDLVGFFAADPRAQKLPKLLTMLAAQLLKERQYLHEESERLQRHVDHAAAIVRAQQGLARPAPILERLEVASIVDAALDAEGPWKDQHQIHIYRHYETVPMVVIDRHKLLAIVVNLLRNAREALVDGMDPKSITVTIAPCNSGVAVTVSDTGCGIADEARDRIFEHGFTTKSSGHGFGLHASANAARELGGTLEVTSEGVGRGASFALQLPLSRPRQTTVRGKSDEITTAKESDDA